MRINCQCNAAKMAPNTNRHNFACNNLEYNKLKASKINLHVEIENQKATLFINYAFQGIERFERENF